jgi:hypothetical protein
MATLRDKALRLFAKARPDLIDAKAGLRRYRVFVRRSVPSDGRGGIDAVWTVTDTELLEKPRVRAATNADKLRSGGAIEDSMWLMDRVTPRNDAGTVGVAISSIAIAPQFPGEEIRIVIVGEDMPAYVPGPTPSGGGEFTIVGSRIRNFEHSFILAPAAGRTSP